MKLPWSAGRMPRLNGYRSAVVVAVALACIVVAGSSLVWFGHRAWTASVPQFTPSCSWPLRVHGKATPEQAGLATATFTPSQMASTYVLLTIDYSDGASEKTGLMNMIAMGGSSAWRMAGT